MDMCVWPDCRRRARKGKFCFPCGERVVALVKSEPGEQPTDEELIRNGGLIVMRVGELLEAGV